jgi:hypothetical protein
VSASRIAITATGYTPAGKETDHKRKDYHLKSFHMQRYWHRMVSVATSTGQYYQSEDGLERAVVDLVRVGARGHGSGVRQLASRLMRTVPPGVDDAEAFRKAIHDALAAVAHGAELRFSDGAVPTEADSTHRLADVDPLPNGDGLVLNEKVMAQLLEVVTERRFREELHRASVRLTRTVLLSGEPGVGKTMAARWLAQALAWPLVTLDLSSVVSSYLGTSGRNIKAVLDYAKSGPCVLLLDEFDAIAKRRDDDTDIGELKRIVNVILVELDRWPDSSLLVAATNHPQLLDPAAGRRFDRAIELPLPGIRERRVLLQSLAVCVDDIDDRVVDLVAELTEGINGSDLTRLWELCRRRAILRAVPTTDMLIEELARRTGDSGPGRDSLFAALRTRLNLSNRQIAALAGVSHPTVAAAIKRSRTRL